MNDKQCEACIFLENPAHLIAQTRHWNVVLDSNHAYLGRAFVTLRSHKGSLSDLSNEEWEDFRELVRKLEDAYHKAFGADPLNWSCLMNNAYQTKPFNPHVHWHLVPRHEKPVHIGGLIFKDEEFGHMFDPYKERVVSDEIVEQIAEKLRARLDS